MYSIQSPDDFQNGFFSCLDSMRSLEWHKWMERVVLEWPIAARYNLVVNRRNGKAWVGQSAICLWRGYPASLTKSAWWHLTKDRQDRANAAAEHAISNYLESGQLLLWDDKKLESTF